MANDEEAVTLEQGTPADEEEAKEGDYDDDEEDEDFDFNPFLQCSPSGEASSSISSENDDEVLEDDRRSPPKEALSNERGVPWLDLGTDMEDDGNYEDEDEYAEEVESPDGSNEEITDHLVQQQTSTSMLEIEPSRDNVMEVAGLEECKRKEEVDDSTCNDSGVDEGTNKPSEKSEEELLGQTMESLPDLKSPRKSCIQRQRCQTNEEDAEDAIFKRTRARYSLVDLSLDELETFLQESDEDDYFQNVDDEEEYRKFLAAVTGNFEGSGGQDTNQNKDEDEDDEDNDADFELEIEEALESEDDGICRKDRKRKHWETADGPETREKSKRRISTQSKDKVLGLTKTRLRPLLPSTTKSQAKSLPPEGRNSRFDQSLFKFQGEQANMTNGFTAHQLGQLYCLISEHVQLLIQVFALCILEPSKQHIAEEAKKMLVEMVDKRDQVLTWRKIPYPDYCFRPPYTHPSALENICMHPMPFLPDNFVPTVCPPEFQTPCSFSENSSNNIPLTSQHGTDNAVFQSSRNAIPLSDSYRHPNTGDSAVNVLQSGWAPLISGPIYSVLDVASLPPVREFLNDVTTVSQEHRQRYVQFGEYHSQCERVPLFHLPSVDPTLHPHRPSTKGGSNCLAPSQTQQKKTMAAALVESSKKQSVALVPAEVVKTVQRFCPFFNAALFPHKPPPAANANRVLFTDAEDGLLALGIMAYNNDWRAIQERFLPCKSTHQIYVRAKNRSSARAPENSIKEELLLIRDIMLLPKMQYLPAEKWCCVLLLHILSKVDIDFFKAVRQLKASPLTTEEKACISEGLKMFKSDWIQVWQFCVPYRDPTLLPRQWRISQGIQKSYKADVATRERRRLYEARRRKAKAALKEGNAAIESEGAPNTENDDGDENSGDDNPDDVDEAYIHEAFIADGKPSTPAFTSPTSQTMVSSSVFNVDSSGIHKIGGLGESFGIYQANSFSGKWPLDQGLGSQNSLQKTPQVSQTLQGSNCMPASLRSTRFTTFKGRHIRTPVSVRPYRTRKRSISQTVKLAPDLPTLNLPPSVRVIPRSVLTKNQCCTTDHASCMHPNTCNSTSHSSIWQDPPQIPKDTRDETAKSKSFGFGNSASVLSSTAGMCHSFCKDDKQMQNYIHKKTENLKQGNSTLKEDHEFSQCLSVPKIMQMDECRVPEQDRILNDTENIHVHPMLLHSSETPTNYHQKDNGISTQEPLNIHKKNSDISESQLFASNLQSTILPNNQACCLSAPVSSLPVDSADFHPLLQRSTEVIETTTCSSALRINKSVNSRITPMDVSRAAEAYTEIQRQNDVHQPNIMNLAKNLSGKQSARNITSNNTKKGSKVEERMKEHICVKEATGEVPDKGKIIGNKRPKTTKDVSVKDVSDARFMSGDLSVAKGQENGINLDACGCESQNACQLNAAMDRHKDYTDSADDFIISEQVRKDDSKTNNIYINEDSLPGIVMEQEELSDSEDEIGESVHFECEEISDSDEEASTFIQQSGIAEKEEQRIEFEEEEIISDEDETKDECKDQRSISEQNINKHILPCSSQTTNCRNFVRNREKRAKCWEPGVGSVDTNSEETKSNPKQMDCKRSNENAHLGSARNRKQKNTTGS